MFSSCLPSWAGTGVSNAIGLEVMPLAPLVLGPSDLDWELNHWPLRFSSIWTQTESCHQLSWFSILLAATSRTPSKSHEPIPNNRAL